MPRINDQLTRQAMQLQIVTRQVTRRLGLTLVAFLVVACADGEVRVPAQKSAQEAGFRIVDVTAQNVPAVVADGHAGGGTTLPAGNSGEYRIGVGDIVSVFVFDHPELTVPSAEGERAGGFLVQSDGTFSYPFIGQVEARGRTVGEIREDMIARLDKYIAEPQIDVRIASFNSQRVVVGGEVGSPTTQSITTWPLTILEAINGAGGLTEVADASRVVVRRKGESYIVNLDGFLGAQTGSTNPILFGGDVVSVPRKRREEVYVLGEVGQPATVDVSEEQVSVTQALARQGGLDQRRADASGVFVFRNEAGETVIYRIDLRLPTGLVLGTRFILAPNDIVYVTRSPIQRWNDTISRILPTVSAARTATE